MDQKIILNKMNQDLSALCSTSLGRRAFLSALPILIASCSSSEKSRYREGDNKGQDTALSVADEKKMTQEYLPQMMKEYPPVKNSYAQGYISNLGHKIASANGLNGNPYQYQFTLVDAKMVNAFALPAGQVFVTTPLLKMAKTEAELAGVVGHEIGHVQARHTAERMNKAKSEQKKSLIYGAIGGLIGGAGGFFLGKKLCREDDRDCLQRVAAYGALAGGAGGLLIQKFKFMANSREDEMEADRIGFKTAMKAGFHSGYVGNFYAELLKMEEQHKSGQNRVMASFTDALSTHPPSRQRVAQQQELSREFSGSAGIISSREFKKAQSLF